MFLLILSHKNKQLLQWAVDFDYALASTQIKRCGNCKITKCYSHRAGGELKEEDVIYLFKKEREKRQNRARAHMNRRFQ
jgi:hypothetical protein